MSHSILKCRTTLRNQPRCLGVRSLARKALALAVIGIVTNSAYASVSIANLKVGKTAFEIAGATTSPLIVMIHGVSGPMSVWDAVFDPLVRAGFRVLRYDLMGRGQSERVRRAYDQSLFQSQLNELLEHLGVNQEPIIIMGSSMGNIIGSEFAKSNPSRIRSLVMFGPAGFRIGGGLLQSLYTMPIVGDALVSVIGKSIIMRRNREYFYDLTPFGAFLENYEEQLNIPGSTEAILSTMRHMPVNDYRIGYEAFGKLKIPTLLLWGQQDISFDFKFSKDLLQAIPHALFVPVSNAAHLPQLERAEAILPTLLTFIKTPM